MKLYISTDVNNAIVDICSDELNIGVPGVNRYLVEIADPWIGDHFDGVTLTKDSPARTTAAALAADNVRLVTIVNGLQALQSQFETDVGGPLTAAQVAQWRAGIDGVTSIAQWKPYEKRASLLLIDALIYLLRRIG